MHPKNLHHQQAVFDYSGVTFVVDKPSRHDIVKLIAGFAEDVVLKPALCADSKKRTRLTFDFRSLTYHQKELQSFPSGTKVVLLCGPASHRALSPVGKELKLNEARGNIYVQDGITFISTYYPQDCLDFKDYEGTHTQDKEDASDVGKEKDHSPTRRPNWKYWFCNDVQKALTIAEGRISPDQFYQVARDFNVEVQPSMEELSDAIDKQVGGEVCLDIETGPNYCITCIGIYFSSTHKLYVVPLIDHQQELCYDRKFTIQFFRLLQRLFNRRDTTFILHNGSFDLLILAWRYHIVPPVSIYDTMVVQHRLEPEAEKSLGHCISLYLHEACHKQDGLFSPKSYAQLLQLWEYNGKDVATTYLIYKKQQEILAKDKRLAESCRVANTLVRPYLLQSLMGIKIDVERLRSETAELERYDVQLKRILHKLVGYPINPASPTQVANYLYKWKKMKEPKKDKTNSVTLYRLLLSNNIPAIRVILKIREIEKEIGYNQFSMWSQSLDWFTNSPVITGTKSFRLASRQLLGTWGGNIQNRKKKQRKIMIPDDGKVFVQTDQSGAEAVVMAYICPPGRLRELVEVGIKAHVYIGLHMFPDKYAEIWGISEQQFRAEFTERPIAELPHHKDWKQLDTLIKSTDKWEANKRYYFMQKGVVHASNYDMGPTTFRLTIIKRTEGQVNLSARESKDFLGVFHTTFPEVHRYHADIKNQLYRNRELHNLYGDRRVFHRLINDTLCKDAYSWIPQSTVGMLTNRAVVKMQDAIDNKIYPWLEGVDIINNVHDSMCSQAPREHALKVAELQEKYMSEHFITKYGEFTMQSESEIGDNWGTMNDKQDWSKENETSR